MWTVGCQIICKISMAGQRIIRNVKNIALPLDNNDTEVCFMGYYLSSKQIYPSMCLWGQGFYRHRSMISQNASERERERVWSTVIKSLVLQTTSTEIKPLSNLVALYHLLTFPFRYFFSGIAFLSRLLLWSLIFVCHFGSLSLWEAAWATFSEHFFASSMQDATLLPCDCLFVFGGFGEFFLMYTQTGLG